MFFFLSSLTKIFFTSIVCVFLMWPARAFCADFDGDGLSDADETNIYHTDPHFADTDGDGINDATEVAFWRNSWSVDSDGDGFNALLDYDSDNDGFSDGQEMSSGSNAASAKSIPIEPPLFSIQKLVVGLGGHEEYEGWVDVMGGGYAHERWIQVNWPDFNASGGATRVASGDIDGDGKDEIIIGLGPVEDNPSIPGGVFEVLDDDFTHLAWGEIGWSDYNQANGESRPGTGDIDGDGKDEIMIGLGARGSGGVEVFDYSSGTLVHRAWIGVDWEDYNQTSGETRVASGDIDGDGKDEIIIGLGPVEDDPSIPGGVFEVLDDDFTHLAWGEIGWSDYNQANGESWPGTGDIDGDGKDEIVLGLGSGGQGRFEALRLYEDSVLHLNWGEVDWQDYADLYGETHPAAADVDFDGKDEIVVGLGEGGDGWIDILDDASEHYTLLKSVQVGLVEYGQTSGETWPTVRFARILSVNDSDQDGLTDEEEAMLGSFADRSDTDGDGFSDGVELGYGTDPLNKSSRPGVVDQAAPSSASRGAESTGITLAWNPNTEGDLAGYRVYYGFESGNYEAHIDVGNKTTHTLTNLTPEKIYYFAAKAYNTANQESAFSGEISYYYNPSGKTVAIAPSGSITDNLPTFSWYAIPGASQYYLGAKDYAAIKVLKVYSAEATGCASGEAICSITPQVALVNGPCKWAVRPQNSSDDYGEWSDVVAFSIN